MQSPHVRTGKDYGSHWEEKFSSRSWGRYPPEDLVRVMGRTYASVDHRTVSVLELGCGPGANLWFMHREGFNVAGIDGSPSAIEIAQRRLVAENAGLNELPPDLRVGDFSTLPWDDDNFDHVVDVFAIYANTVDVIRATLREVGRVLRPGGRFYSKLWGRETTGFGTGIELEEGTFTNIPAGPCADMGVAHFFDRDEIDRVFADFQISVIDHVRRTDVAADAHIEEFLCQFVKAPT